MSRQRGGYIGNTPTPTRLGAPGVWTLREAEGLQRSGAWPATDDPFLSSVSLLLRMEGTGSTFVDESPTPKTITAIDGATQSTAQSKWPSGKSLLLDGSGDYLTSPINAGYEFGTGDFTVEAWIYPTTIGANARIIGIGQGANGGGPFTGWSFRFLTSGGIGFYRFDGAETQVNSTATASANQWTHVAVARASGVVRVFMGGALSSSLNYSGSYDRVNNDALEVGRVQFGGGGNSTFFTGYIDDIRITKGVARYTAAFTPPQATFPGA